MCSFSGYRANSWYSLARVCGESDVTRSLSGVTITLEFETDTLPGATADSACFSVRPQETISWRIFSVDNPSNVQDGGVMCCNSKARYSSGGSILMSWTTNSPQGGTSLGGR